MKEKHAIQLLKAQIEYFKLPEEITGVELDTHMKDHMEAVAILYKKYKELERENGMLKVQVKCSTQKNS